MAYQLYRNTTLGNTLQESLDELIQVIWKFIELRPSPLTVIIVSLIVFVDDLIVLFFILLFLFISMDK